MAEIHFSFVGGGQHRGTLTVLIVVESGFGCAPTTPPGPVDVPQALLSAVGPTDSGHEAVGCLNCCDSTMIVVRKGCTYCQRDVVFVTTRGNYRVPGRGSIPQALRQFLTTPAHRHFNKHCPQAPRHRLSGTARVQSTQTNK
jgi:hypothetical protein